MRAKSHCFAKIAMILAATATIGASAFADSRHPKTTVGRDGARASVERGRDDDADRRRNGTTLAPGKRVTPGERSQRPPEADRMRAAVADRPRPDANETNVTRNDGQRGRDSGRGREGYRGRDRRDDGQSRGGTNYRSSQQPHYTHGKISKVRPYGSGYRVWIYGSSYPYYIPSAYYRHGHFDVGMTIRVGGYYNPRGWYDYYGDYECDSIAEKRLRGVVERVNYHDGVFELDLVGGGDIWVTDRDAYTRVHPGDYVVVYGDWNRWGNFVAFDIDLIDGRYRW